ncbi:MAG: cyclopropane-fatty-acyl-phospholipid synthase family protein, partial [Myxococcota bacterium]|nr:cyclopropane-fatty-acyl-phospholipid synthase family protein [Myxococcota bacterium]
MSELPCSFSPASPDLDAVAAVRGGAPWHARLLGRLARRRLEGLREGALVLEEPGLPPRRFGDPQRGPSVRVRVHDAAALWTALASGGIVGGAEAYAEGAWDCDDLTALVRLFLRNPEGMNGFEGGPARLAGLLRALGHRARRNHRRGARRNIAAHYDLGNDFFAAFLDPTMTYSCAFFEDASVDLETAQRAKYDRIAQKLRLGPADHVLEIGTGWGGFALHAAARTGCRVTTTTISRRQLEEARERVARAGLEGRVEVLLEDYRDLRGRYDKLVSIEMIEAVGPDYLDSYFGQIDQLLKPDGMALIQ